MAQARHGARARDRAGYATVGRIGFEGRYDYAALGSVANLASRLSTHAAAGQTLIGPRAFAAVEESVLTEPVRNLDLKGFGQPVQAHEVRGLRVELDRQENSPAAARTTGGGIRPHRSILDRRWIPT